MEIINYSNIVLRLLSIVIVSIWVLPPAWKEAKIVDGIWVLRKAIFFGLLAYNILNMTILSMVLIRIIKPTEWATPLGSWLNGFQAISIALVLYFIYNRGIGRLKKE